MSPAGKSRAARQRTILEAATTVFMRDGYHGASMDEIVALAGVSKPTVYRYYADKEHLFGEIIRTTMDRLDSSVEAAALTLDSAQEPGPLLREIGRRLLTSLLAPQVLQLRRLVIGEAGRFPELGRVYWEGGFQKGVATLAAALQGMAERGWLRVPEPALAAGQFAGLVLWVPVTQALMCGREAVTEADIERHIDAAVSSFLATYARTR